jgi:hypothetical protein
VEHVYQASKTVDTAVRKEIAALSTPGKAKKLGKSIKLRPDWDTIKLDVMYELVKQKFSKPELAKKLLATGTSELVEGNKWKDRFWGRAWKGDMYTMEGENHLGRILMRVRDELRASLHEKAGHKE